VTPVMKDTAAILAQFSCVTIVWHQSVAQLLNITGSMAMLAPPKCRKL